MNKVNLFPQLSFLAQLHGKVTVEWADSTRVKVSARERRAARPALHVDAAIGAGGIITLAMVKRRFVFKRDQKNEVEVRARGRGAAIGERP